MSHELLAMLPGFIGHSVAQRQEFRARTSFAARFGAPAQKLFQVKLTAAELQQTLDTWAESVYGDRVHSGLAGKRPNQVAEWTGEVRRLAMSARWKWSPRTPLVRRLGREGVQLAGTRFIATPETIGAYVAHVGENALIYPDPSGDMGRAFVFLDSSGGRTFSLRYRRYLPPRLRPQQSRACRPPGPGPVHPRKAVRDAPRQVAHQARNRDRGVERRFPMSSGDRRTVET
jgi:putative transposase